MEKNSNVTITSILEKEHRESLLLCWKIREGFRNNIPVKRIKEYVDWFWENRLKELMDVEEEYIISTLPLDSKLRKKVMSQHRKLRKLFEEKEESQFLKSLTFIEEILEVHIRFAEKELFHEFMKNATQEQLLALEKEIHATTTSKWKDPFWEAEKSLS